MGKAPAFQFYVRDWVTDPELQPASFSTQGIWIKLICFMWEASERGQLNGCDSQYQRMIGCSIEEWNLFKQEAEELHFCNIVTHRNKKITVINRRMVNDYKKTKGNKIRQKRLRDKQKQDYNGQSNAKVTPLSSSSSSSSKKTDQRVASPANADSFKTAKDYVGDLWEQIKTEGENVWELRNDFNVAQWISWAVKKKYHPQAILDTLTGVKPYICNSKNPVGYCNTVLRTKSGNAYEQEAFKDHEKNMKMWAVLVDGLKGS